jgi:hypothetical protein
MRMAENVINAAIKSSPECIDSDKIPRLFVENPITNFSIVSAAEAIIEVIATLTFSSSALLLSKKENFVVDDVADSFLSIALCVLL